LSEKIAPSRSRTSIGKASIIKIQHSAALRSVFIFPQRLTKKEFLTPLGENKNPLLAQRIFMIGRGEKTRTSGLVVPNDARCQLRYTPINIILKAGQNYQKKIIERELF
jgi:hypothetical protein